MKNLETLLAAYRSMMMSHVEVDAIVKPKFLGDGEYGYEITIHAGEVEFARGQSSTIDDAAAGIIDALREQGAKL